MAIDWTKIYDKYKGLWVALKDDEKTVVASGKTAKEAWQKSQKKGYKKPIMIREPAEIIPYIGGFALEWNLNTSRAFLHEITIKVGGWPHKKRVGFSYDIAPYGYGILGQKGFFDIFVVKFDLLKGDIELRPRDGQRY